MSELTRCNHCSLLIIQYNAQRKGYVVTKRGDTTPGGTFPNGCTILMHPPDVEPNRDEHFVAWFADLTTHCVC